MQSNNQSQSKHHYKSFWPIIIIAVLSFLIGGAFVLAIYNTGLEDQISSLMPGGFKALTEKRTALREIKEQTSVSMNLTKDWDTYRNEQYGFEVKYPSDFEVRDLTPENSQYVKNILILIGLCDTRFITSCNGTTIQIYKGEFREPSIWVGTEVKRFERNGLTFWLGGNSQILSTFKFTK